MTVTLLPNGDFQLVLNQQEAKQLAEQLLQGKSTDSTEGLGIALDRLVKIARA